MKVQDSSNEFSDESDIEEIPGKENKGDSNADFVIQMPTIKRQHKPKKGQWIVKLEKLTKCQKCNIFLLNSNQAAKHQQKHLSKSANDKFRCDFCKGGFQDVMLQGSAMIGFY